MKTNVENWEKLLKAIEEGNATLMDCKLRDTGEPVTVICTVEEQEGGGISMTPFAALFNGNPYDILVSRD